MNVPPYMCLSRTTWKHSDAADAEYLRGLHACTSRFLRCNYRLRDWKTSAMMVLWSSAFKVT